MVVEIVVETQLVEAFMPDSTGYTVSIMEVIIWGHKKTISMYVHVPTQ